MSDDVARLAAELEAERQKRQELEAEKQVGENTHIHTTHARCISRLLSLFGSQCRCFA